MKLKRIAAAVLSLTLMCGAVTFNNVYMNDSVVYASQSNTTGTYGPFTYINYGNYIEISDCDESATEVEIPSEIDGLPVTTIGVTAFASCKNLLKIDIPESVVNFEYWAFYGTLWLENKRVENPLVIINNVLVDGLTCTGNIIIPEGVTKIAEKAFCQSALGGYVGTSPEPSATITSIQLPKTLKNIEYMAFARCENLTEVVIPENIEYVDNTAFLDCENNNSYLVLSSDYNMEFLSMAWTFGNKPTVYVIEGSDAHTNAEAMYMESLEYYDEGTFKIAFISDLYGDIDSDSEVNSSDASSVLAEYAKTATGGEKSFSPIQTIAADVNKDGVVDSSDASSILAYYAYTATGGTQEIEDFLGQ